MAGNSGIDNNIATASGVNVLAPTWYSVTDSSGKCHVMHRPGWSINASERNRCMGACK